MRFVSRVIYAGRLTGLITIIVLIAGAVFAPHVLRDYVAGASFFAVVFAMTFLLGPAINRRFPRL